MDFGQGLAPPSAARLLANGNGESRHWTGIGRLNDLPGNRQCMGTLLDTRAPGGVARGPAYVLTAGHCVSKRNGVIVQDHPLQATITFNYFADTITERHRVAVRRAVWSSIQGRDLALLELDAPLQQLLDHDIAPLMMAAPAPAGSAVLVVGEASRPDIGLRLRACTEQDLPVLLQQPWLWRRLKSNDCRGVGEGVSGSPVLERASNRVIGVINSISGERVTSIPVGGLLDCFSDGRLDLDIAVCPLSPGFQLVQQSNAAFKRLYKLGDDDNGNPPPPSWNFAFTLDTQRYRYKATRDALACEDPDGYSGTLPAMGTVLINDPIGPETGWHFLCVVGVDSAEDLAWRGLLANALSIAVELLPAAAVPAPDMTVERLENGDLRVSWRTEPPDLQRYRVKKGSPEQTDCADSSGYRMLRHQQYVFKRAELPLKLCSQAEDIVKQRSAPREDLLEAGDQ
ncbi:trypsin-like serine peptidase [Pseudomonas sp. CAM1A]|uniref:trypsin-like serine peptidase n=1 Tax=Pseudomonas sp. CAM1A TaxID=3231717 RepID=UPI0039C75381